MAGGFFDGLLNATQSPLFLGGANLLMGGGPQGMMEGMKTGAGFQEMQRKRQMEEAQKGALGPLLGQMGMGQEDQAYVMANPEVAANILQGVYQNRYSAPKQTDDQREYNFAREQGFNGTFMDYQTSLKRAGAPQTMLTTDMRAENAEAKARGEGIGKRFNTIADDGYEAQKDSALIDRLAGLSNNVEPGAKTAALEAIRSATGIALDPNTDNVQAMQAAVNYMVPRMRVPGSGATSDFDAQTFVRSLPSLYGTPEGNRIITETMGGLNQNRRAAGEIAQRWQRGEITATQADAEIKKLPDPFVSFKRVSKGMNQQGAAELPVLSPEQAQQLPPGTRFKTTDGRILTRK